VIDHLAAKTIEMCPGRGRRRHAQGDDASNDRRSDRRLVEHGDLRRDDAIRAQALQSPLDGGRRKANLGADGFGNAPRVVLIQTKDFTVDAIQRISPSNAAKPHQDALKRVGTP
jgi:hypothetical protein